MKQKLFTIMMAAVIFLTLVAPVHTAADIALPVDEPIDRYETVTDIGGDSPLTSIADGCSILNYVDEKDFLSNGFIRRVETEESLNSYVFEREDGTRRLYLLGEDIKFEAADGTVLEKDITLNKTGEGYSTVRNNIGLSISESLSDGVQIFFGDNKLSLLPADMGVRYSAVLRDNTIVYSGVYGEGTELVFTPTLSGVKQDVVLNSYTGNNVFEYIIFSETLSPFSIENRVFFAENENSDYRFDFGPIYIYDAAGHFTSGDMEIAEIDEGRWLITIIAPTEFLESDNTIYPVTIDPTIQVKASESTAYIEDTTIYSGKPNLNTGSWLYNHTGLLSDGYDVGRMLVRIPGLYDSNTTYAYLHVEQIDNVSFCIYEASGSASQRVDLYYYNGTAWTESTATWNNTSPNGYGYLFDTKYPGNGLKTTFDITDLVKGWKNGTYTASKGFLLKSYNESDGNKYKAFDASESTTSSRKPYVVLDYTPVISINESVININEGESYTPTVSTLSTGPVYWMSSNSSVASVDSTGKITAIKASSSSVSITACTLFHNNLYLAGCTVYVKIPDGTYYIKNKSTERYADASGYSVGDEVLRWHFHGASNQRWDIEYISNGLYSIKNKMSNLYLGVETLNSTSSITRQYSALGDSTKWYISKTSSGAYCFYAKGNLTYSYVIGADPLNNNTIVNMTYSNDSDYKDEWNLIRTAAYSIGGEFHSGNDVIDASNNWALCGYDSSYSINPAVGCLSQNNLSSTVVYFSSHGNQHCIKLLNSVYLTDGLISLPTNGVAISDIYIYKPKLYIYDACLTASNEDGTGKNLCTQTLAQGAECVIGWPVSIGATDARNWQARFQDKLVEGFTVLQAANYANTFSYNNNTTIKDWRIFGNDSVVIDLHSSGSKQQMNQPIDNSNIIYPNDELKSISTLEHEIINEIESYDYFTYDRTVTYTNDMKTNYVIDFVCKFNGYNTDNGYTLIVENGKVLYISKHMKEIQRSNLIKHCVSIDSVNSDLISEALNYARDQSGDQIVLNQSYDFYYDIAKDEYFCRVMTTTSDEDGCCSAYFTLYSL